jgi:GTP cyclohydrolase I
MSMRGVEKQNSVAVTSAMLGGFREDARTRMEFLELIKRPELSDRSVRPVAAPSLACVGD